MGSRSERIALGVIVIVVILVAVLGRKRYDAGADAKMEKMGHIIAELGRLDHAPPPVESRPCYCDPRTCECNVTEHDAPGEAICRCGVPFREAVASCDNMCGTVECVCGVSAHPKHGLWARGHSAQCGPARPDLPTF